jgi:hypothetical protein
MEKLPLRMILSRKKGERKGKAAFALLGCWAGGGKAEAKRNGRFFDV